jgi:hypothetical protein
VAWAHGVFGGILRFSVQPRVPLRSTRALTIVLPGDCEYVKGHSNDNEGTRTIPPMHCRLATLPWDLQHTQVSPKMLQTVTQHAQRPPLEVQRDECQEA